MDLMVESDTVNSCNRDQQWVDGGCSADEGPGIFVEVNSARGNLEKHYAGLWTSIFTSRYRYVRREVESIQ